MTPDSYHDFFVAIAGADGALVGLLFVAVSLSPRKLRDPRTARVAQAQATAALLVFTSVLTIALFALIPSQDIGWASTVVAGLGLIYALAICRVAVAQRTKDRAAVWPLARIGFGTLALCGFQLWAGLEILTRPAEDGAHTLALTSAVGLVFGISRAWELIGLQGTGLSRSLQAFRHPDEGLTGDGPEEA